MKKNTLVVIGIMSVLSVVIIFTVFFQKEPNTQAQEKMPEKTEQKVEGLTAEEKELIQKVQFLADKIEMVMKEKESKWKLEKKFSGQTDRTRESEEKGNREIIIVKTYLQFKKRGMAADVNFNTREPSTNEETSQQWKSGFRMISRGIVNNFNIGDEGAIVTDIIGSPSNYVYASFRKGKNLIRVGVNSRFGNRLTHEKEVKKIAAIVNSVMDSAAENQSKE